MYVYVQRVLLAYNFHSMHCNNKKGPLLELEKSKPLAQFEVYTGVLSKAYIYIYVRCTYVSCECARVRCHHLHRTQTHRFQYG